MIFALRNFTLEVKIKGRTFACPFFVCIISGVTAYRVIRVNVLIVTAAIIAVVVVFLSNGAKS